MKYLFFDIECSNCFNGIGKMCEFGYVITDESFNNLRKYEFVMSPGKGRDCRFFLEGRKNQNDLSLAYDYSYYFSQPEFPSFYESIKNILEAPDTICFAWSSRNDLLHLLNTCKRYKKEPLKFICYDVQKIADKYLDVKNQTALEEACRKIVGPNSTVKFQQHLSSDDAMMTMMVLDAICVLEGIDTQTLLEKSDYAKDDGFRPVKKYRHKKKVADDNHERYEHYKKVSDQDLKILSTCDMNGKRFNFSGELKTKIDNLQSPIDKVHSLGCILTDTLDETDFFVTYDEGNKEDLMKKLEGKYHGKYLLINELMCIQ